MRSKLVFFVLAAVCGASVACGAGSSPPEAVASEESNVEPTTPDGGVAEAGLGVDFSGVPAKLAQSESQSSLAMSGFATLLYSFLPPGQGLDPLATPAANASRVAASLQAASCSTAQVAYLPDTEYLTVDFGTSCAMAGSGLVVSGGAQVGFTGDGATYAEASLLLRRLVVAGYTLDGFADVSSTSTGLRLDTHVTVKDIGDLTFTGTSTWVDGGPVAELTGSGIFTGTKFSTASNDAGVSCISSAQSFLAIRAMRKSPSDCFAGSGGLDVRTAFVCRAETSAPGDYASTVSFASIGFDSSTAHSGAATFNVTVPGRVDDDGTPMTSTVTLPAASCP